MKHKFDFNCTCLNRCRSITYNALAAREKNQILPRAQKFDQPNVVRPPSQNLGPIPPFPESETFHIRVIITHWRVPIRRSMKVDINKFFQIRSNNLICINENDLLQVHWKQDVKEEDFVAPDDALLFCLCP